MNRRDFFKLSAIALAGLAMPKWAIETGRPIVGYWKHIDGCDGVAFFMTRRWSKGDLIMAEDIIWPDGHQAYCGEIVKCGTCGKYLNIHPWVLAVNYFDPERPEPTLKEAGGDPRHLVDYDVKLVPLDTSMPKEGE